MISRRIASLRSCLSFCIVVALGLSTLVGGSVSGFLPFELAAIISVVAVLLISSSRVLARKRVAAFSVQDRLRIKVPHIVGGVTLSSIGILYGQGAVTTIAAASLISYGSYECFRWLGGVEVPFITDALGLMGSPEEFEARPFLSPVHAFVGIILVSAFFPPLVAYASILVLALGDGVAGLIGQVAGKHPLRTGSRKSAEGSLAGFTASFTGCLFLIPMELAFVGALVGTITEAFLASDDNLVVPLSSALAIAVAKALFHA
jgi:dolichol kinase